MGLEDYTEEQFERELARRADAKRIKAVPKLNATIDWSGLIEEAEEYIDCLANGRRTKDTAHYMYENVITTLYGRDAFEWINERDESE